MTNQIEEVKKAIYFNPRKTNAILETVSKKHNITKQELITSFIKEESVHPVVYASLIDEASDAINEDLMDFLKNQMKSAKDSFVAKHGFGASKSRAEGSIERRERMEFLFRNWIHVSEKANMQPTEKSLKMFLGASDVDPSAINKAIAAVKPMIKAANRGEPAVLPSGQLRNFFNKVSEFESQAVLAGMAGGGIEEPEYAQDPRAKGREEYAAQQAKTQAPAQTGVITAQAIENYISSLPAEERSAFVVKDIIANLSDADKAKITKALMFKA